MLFFVVSRMHLRVRITKWPCSMTTSHFNTVPVRAGAILSHVATLMLYDGFSSKSRTCWTMNRYLDSRSAGHL